MTVSLVLCLAALAQAPAAPGPPDAPLLSVIEDMKAGRNGDAIEKLTALIEDETREPIERATAYALRGNLWLVQKQPERALDDFRAALDIDSDNVAALLGRASAYEMLGKADLARAERRRAMRRVNGVLGWRRWLSPLLGPLLMFDEPAALAVVVAVPLAVLWAVLGAINFLVGRRQRREGRGSLARLCWVAAVVALLQLSPLVTFLVIVWIARGRLDQWSAVPIAWCLCIFWLAARMGPPLRRRSDRQPLPEVDDPEVLDRVAQLAATMRVAPPVTRLLRSVGGPLPAQAWVGGLPAPSLVVSDGLLQRLPPDERDATIAHELAHIANHSLWWLALPAPLAAVATVVVGSGASVAVPLAFGWALFVGLSRLVSRPIELDCDRRAARAAGFRAMAGAIKKIYAVHPVRNTGWISLLLYATATHPPRDRRLRALVEAAPPGDRPDVAGDPAPLRYHRLAERAALLVWLLALPLALVAAAPGRQPTLALL